MALRRWAISAAGAAGLAALARRRRSRGPGAPAAPQAPPEPPAPNPLVEGGDPAQAIDAARERLRREAEARGGAPSD